MPNSQEQFLKTFKQDHQTILDGLLKLRGAVRQGDTARQPSNIWWLAAPV